MTTRSASVCFSAALRTLARQVTLDPADDMEM